MGAKIITIAAEITKESGYIDPRGSLCYIGKAEMLRNVAATNWDSTKKEFIAAAVMAGFNKDTAAIQFAKSRQIDLSFGYCHLEADGRLIETV